MTSVRMEEFLNSEHVWLLWSRLSQSQHYWHFGLDNSWSCSVPCRIFSSISSFYPLNSGSGPFPLLWHPKKFPGVQNCSLLRTTGWTSGSCRQVVNQPHQKYLMWGVLLIHTGSGFLPRLPDQITWDEAGIGSLPRAWIARLTICCLSGSGYWLA